MSTMKALHSLNTGESKWMWAKVMDLRHHIIPDTHRRRTNHAYRVERGTPPPIGLRYRSGWMPYTTQPDRQTMLNPLCGRLITQSRGPALVNAATWDTSRCPECLRITRERNLPVEVWDTVVNTDPWTMIRWSERVHTPDPITGL